MKVSVPAAVLALCAAALLLLAQAPSAAEASHHLKLGYYKETCPGVEKIVKYHVAKAIKANRGAGAALVRLIFHDCFVRVCHLNSTTASQSNLLLIYIKHVTRVARVIMLLYVMVTTNRES